MEHDLGNSNVFLIRIILIEVLETITSIKMILIRIILIEVMVSNTDSEPAGTLSITAMPSSDHHVILDQRPSTHQRSSNTSTQQRNLVGEFSSISFSSSNNPSASSAQRGGESLLGELGGSGGNSHNSEEDCSSHDQAGTH